MCKKPTSVSHSSTASEIISLDSGLRMDGLLAPDLWDVLIAVLCSSNSTKTPTSPAAGNCSRNHKFAEDFGDLITADHKVLCEGRESPNSHRYAVVVQDIATQWIESYLC